MTLEKLIKKYRTDPQSTYQSVRYCTRVNYDSVLNRVIKKHGKTKLKKIKARTLLEWYTQWVDGTHVGYGYDFIKRLRTVCRFGATLLENKEADRICSLFNKMRFKGLKPRVEILTAAQAALICTKAHELGYPSIALAQAFQFELVLRQKDVIGEWVPLSESVQSDIVVGNEKWARGLRWEEIDENLCLKHTTSKRLKDIKVNLRQASMVMQELSHFDVLPIAGPIIISPTGKPWTSSWYRRKWREIADAAGIPRSVRSMDSRAGGVSEATDAGVPLELVRHATTHSNISMTEKYSRGSEGKISQVMEARQMYRQTNTCP